ncbi:hypothetical protein ACVW0I_005121 [Bradyrhizobium sp. LM6.11]
MRAGDFERAWAINDRDLTMLAYPPKHTGPRHLQRIWRGEDLTGKHVLVRCYHGLGDTIQFLRFMRPLRDIARSVAVWCQSELLPLVQRAAGVDRAFALHDGAPDVDFEVDIEIMEVPHAIKARREHVEMRAPYVSLPPAVEPTPPHERGSCRRPGLGSRQLGQAKDRSARAVGASCRSRRNALLAAARSPDVRTGRDRREGRQYA